MEYKLKGHSPCIDEMKFFRLFHILNMRKFSQLLRIAHKHGVCVCVSIVKRRVRETFDQNRSIIILNRCIVRLVRVRCSMHFFLPILVGFVSLNFINFRCTL